METLLQDIIIFGTTNPIGLIVLAGLFIFVVAYMVLDMRTWKKF